LAFLQKASKSEFAEEEGKQQGKRSLQRGENVSPLPKRRKVLLGEDGKEKSFSGKMWRGRGGLFFANPRIAYTKNTVEVRQAERGSLKGEWGILLRGRLRARMRRSRAG